MTHLFHCTANKKHNNVTKIHDNFHTATCICSDTDNQKIKLRFPLISIFQVTPDYFRHPKKVKLRKIIMEQNLLKCRCPLMKRADDEQLNNNIGENVCSSSMHKLTDFSSSILFTAS